MNEQERLLSMRQELDPDVYQKLKIELALVQVSIEPCKQCGHPVVEGYCCGHCGSANPDGYADFYTVEDIMADSSVFDGFVRDKDTCHPKYKCRSHK